MTRVYDLAHGRAGDKGNTSNISVIAYNDAAWEILQKQLTVDVVAKAFSHITTDTITRYELPKLQALKFVIEGALGGGVTRSLAHDAHGKSFSSLMLSIEIN